jgi:CheY-like chemotaxis protein
VKRNIEGMGLGMPIVFNLSQMMDAQIDIKSEVGKGTHTVIRIPQKTNGHDVLGKETATKLQNFESISVAKKFDFEPEQLPFGRVLVVDDVPTNLYVAKGLLAFYSLSVETCESGDEAIEKVKNGNVYDIIFVDYMMPGMDGIVTMKKMKELGYTKPIIVLTANAIIGQADKFIEEGFDGFLSKPIQTKQLNAILTKHIQITLSPDITESAELYQSNPELQEKLRKNFAKNQKNVVAKINSALSSGDNKTAHLLTHTVKGLAHLINETQLAETAETIENSIKNNEPPPTNIVDTFAQQLSLVLETIEKPPQKTINSEKLLPLLNNLEPLLASHSNRSLRLIADLRDIPEAAILVRQIEKFNFKAALTSLEIFRDIVEG